MGSANKVGSIVGIKIKWTEWTRISELSIKVAQDILVEKK